MAVRVISLKLDPFIFNDVFVYKSRVLFAQASIDLFYSMTVAPYAEIQIILVCAELRPEFSAGIVGKSIQMSHILCLDQRRVFPFPVLPAQDNLIKASPECKSDPSVRAAVATLTTGMLTLRPARAQSHTFTFLYKCSCARPW